MTLPIKTVLKVLTYIITSITVHPIRLTVILVIDYVCLDLQNWPIYENKNRYIK